MIRTDAVFVIACSLMFLWSTFSGHAAEMRPTVTMVGDVAVITPAPTEQEVVIDFNAQPLPLRTPTNGEKTNLRTWRRAIGTPSFEPGHPGTGVPDQVPTILNIRAKRTASMEQETASVMPEAYGLNNAEYPYTTSRVDAGAMAISTTWPFRATGKLYFTDGTYTYSCTASLIKRGLIVTAAHCVTDFWSFGIVYSGWTFVPALRGDVAPFGVVASAKAYVPKEYAEGTVNCSLTGVVCETDVAVIVLKPQNRKYIGERTGHYGYGMNWQGYTPKKIAQITQLGYPGNLDHGNWMQRNDAQGRVDPEQANNTVMGSLMFQGSSGGPWIVNFGIAPKGSKPFAGGPYDIVTAVTSWGTGDPNQILGAAPFTDHNIKKLVEKACKDTRVACKPL